MRAIRIFGLCTLLLLMAVACLAQARTTPVEVTNSPDVNVPDPIKIDPANNTVNTPAKSLTIQPWATDQTVNAFSWLWAPNMNCAGYRDMRVVIKSNTNSPDVKVYVRCIVNSHVLDIGCGNFASPSTSIGLGANFESFGNECIFTVPVFADSCNIAVYNGTSSTVTMKSQSWIYLIN